MKVILAVLLALVLQVVSFYWAISRINDVTWKHHGWYGIAAMLLAGLLNLAAPTLGWWWLALTLLGGALYLDDLVQHLVQQSRPDFRSLGHLLYRHTLYRWFPKLG